MLITTEYNVSMEQLAGLAIVTFRIPDLSDPVKKARIPPSQHKATAGLLLQGCAQNEDPLAVVQILTAVYSSSLGSDAPVRDFARLFPSAEVSKYRKTLVKLAEKAKTFTLGPDVLTLQGLFLEQEGHRMKAKSSYEEAILRSHLTFQPKSKHPMQLPLVAPWNAMGQLLKSESDPSVQAQAKIYYEKGAIEGDDPLAYYELSLFEPQTSTKWLQYTSKAAASGHRQAMVSLAKFYQEVSLQDSPLLQESDMKKALNWLLGWKSGSAVTLAREWLQAASNIGHKPSMLRLADHYESSGENQKARDCLQNILDAPAVAGQNEEWPQLVQLARRRLNVVRA